MIALDSGMEVNFWSGVLCWQAAADQAVSSTTASVCIAKVIAVSSHERHCVLVFSELSPGPPTHLRLHLGPKDVKPMHELGQQGGCSVHVSLSPQTLSPGPTHPPAPPPRA